MDYIKLANLLFPDVDLTVKECFEAFPKRILPEKAEVVRIAPSPTGYLHIGSVYGAFIDKLIAYHTNGVYYMRLEDTDSKREVENAGDIAYNMLSLFGLKPDEGYAGSDKKEIGAYGEYVQSKRQRYYLAFAKDDEELLNQVKCECHNAKIGCRDCKKRLSNLINEKFKPIREKRLNLSLNQDDLKQIINEGNKKVRIENQKILDNVKEIMQMYN